MSVELALIRSVLDGRMTGSMDRALRLGVSIEKFNTDAGETAWSFLLEHWRDADHFHAIPSMDLFNSRFPSLDLPAANDPIEVLAKRLQHEHSERLVRKAANKILKDLDVDSNNPLDLVDWFRANTSQLRVSDKRAAAKPLSLLLEQHVITPYHNPTVSRGLPFPWRFLNEQTQGMEPGQVYIYYGRPASGKSWYLAKTVANLIKQQKTNLRVLLLSGDMSEEKFTRYLACCIAEIPVWDLLEVTLTLDEYKRLLAAWKMIEELENNGGCINVISVPGITAGELFDLAADMNANFVVIDALYRMKDERTGRTSTEPIVQSNIVQSVKDGALTLNIPVLATTQANRAGEDVADASMTEQAFTDAIAQESAFLMRIKPLKNVDGTTDRALYFPKVRDSKEGFIEPQRVGGLPAVDFRHKGPYVTKKVDTTRIKKSGTDEGTIMPKKTKWHKELNN